MGTSRDGWGIDNATKTLSAFCLTHFLFYTIWRMDYFEDASRMFKLAR